MEKYFNGETSLEEESTLREFFAGGDVPPRLKGMADYFKYIRLEKAVALDKPGFDSKLEENIGESRLARLFDLRRPLVYWIAGIAASVLILVAIFVRFDPLGGSIRDTYDDPVVAYDQAKKILMFVSTKMNHGTRDVQKVEKFDQGLKDLQTVSTFNKGLNEVNRVGEVEKVKNMISNN